VAIREGEGCICHRAVVDRDGIYTIVPLLHQLTSTCVWTKAQDHVVSQPVVASAWGVRLGFGDARNI
jgi:hypothetical protein